MKRYPRTPNPVSHPSLSPIRVSLLAAQTKFFKHHPTSLSSNTKSTMVALVATLPMLPDLDRALNVHDFQESRVLCVPLPRPLSFSLPGQARSYNNLTH